MKKLLIALVTIASFNAMAVTCSGQGFTVSVDGGQIQVAGNGLNVTAPVQDYGSYFSANVGQQGIRSVTLAPFSGSMTLVKERGVQTVKVSCN